MWASHALSESHLLLAWMPQIENPSASPVRHSRLTRHQEIAREKHGYKRVVGALAEGKSRHS